MWNWRSSWVISCVEASRPLPDFVDIDLQDRTLPDGILLEHLKAFQTLYREHCEVGSREQTQDNTRFPCLCPYFDPFPMKMSTNHNSRIVKTAYTPSWCYICDPCRPFWMWWSTFSSLLWRHCGNPSGGSARAVTQNHLTCKCQTCKNHLIEEIIAHTCMCHNGPSPAGTMSLRSVCQSRAWWCCVSLILCCAGRESAITCSTRLWWRSSSLMYWDPSLVS